MTKMKLVFQLLFVSSIISCQKNDSKQEPYYIRTYRALTQDNAFLKFNDYYCIEFQNNGFYEVSSKRFNKILKINVGQSKLNEEDRTRLRILMNNLDSLTFEKAVNDIEYKIIAAISVMRENGLVKYCTGHYPDTSSISYIMFFTFPNKKDLVYYSIGAPQKVDTSYRRIGHSATWKFIKIDTMWTYREWQAD